MATFNKYNQEIIVWIVVVTVFTALTIFAVNFDDIRHAALFQ